jgi:predicted transcriptional regulator
MVALTRKQREALVKSLYENGKTYREIAQELKISPNSIKAILNKAGLDQATTISSRAFELYSEQKTPLQVAITLGLKADEAINLHQEYFKLLGINEFTRIYPEIKENPWPFVKLVKLAQDEGMSEVQLVELLKVANGHLPRVTSQYEKLKAEINSLEYEKSNSAKDYQQLRDGISNLHKTENQLQLTIEELQRKKAKLDLQREMTENFVKEYQDNNVEYNKVKQAIQGEVENVLTDRKQLLRVAVRSTIELLRLEPQKFRLLYYNTSTIHPENDEDPVLVEAEGLYGKMLENIANKVVTNLSDDISSVSSFAQKEPSEQNWDPVHMSAAYLYAKEERTSFEPEDKDIETAKKQSFKERPDVQASFRMGSYPRVGQARHPNLDRFENELMFTTGTLCDKTASQIHGDENDADVTR